MRLFSLPVDQRQQLREAALRRAEWFEDLIRRMDEVEWDRRDPFYQAAVEACCGVQRMVALIGNVTPIAAPTNPGRRQTGPRPPTPPGEPPPWTKNYGPG